MSNSTTSQTPQDDDLLINDDVQDETAPALFAGGDVTRPAPSGFDTYILLTRPDAAPVIFSYYDLWALIVCRKTLDGDWQRARQAAGMVPDATRKKAIMERLWTLERELNGLPIIPDPVMTLHLHRAHVWFNHKMVEAAR